MRVLLANNVGAAIGGILIVLTGFIGAVVYPAVGRPARRPAPQ